MCKKLPRANSFGLGHHAMIEQTDKNQYFLQMYQFSFQIACLIFIINKLIETLHDSLIDLLGSSN